MENQTLITKTFKEVHEELENEHMFLQKNHDIKNFQEKADFLNRVGFINSIATKLYDAIGNNHNIVEEYARKYHNQYKFIFKPQLARVCEKYNLFVRDTRYFMGDIPEKNIKEMMGFKAYINDLDIGPGNFIKNRIQWLHHFRNCFEGLDDINYKNEKVKISIKHFRENGLGHLIQIAAVKSLFHEEAFQISNSRILNEREMAAMYQVELDPIVLCQTIHGYIIITAWGDEANDELVVNQNNN